MGRRAARIEREIDDECGLRLDPLALEELVYCRFVEPHEGRKPSYGAIVWRDPPGPHNAVPQLPSLGTFTDNTAPLEVLRWFADGRTSFVVRVPGSTPMLAIDPKWIGTEQALAAYAQRTGATILQRLPSGRVRLFCERRVYWYHDGAWLVRPTAFAYHDSVALQVDENSRDIAQGILNVCVHSLSPAGIGATLVWLLQKSDATEGLDLSTAFSPPSLSASDPLHASAIASALAQLDRAVLVDCDGRVVSLNVTLTNGENQAELHFDGGMRHNSAGRLSALRPDTIVFVVSADGPVTVFRAGKVIASIES